VRGEYGLTFNAGTIQGGTTVEYDPQQNRGTTFGKTNVVPRKVIVHGGIRTVSEEQLERTRERMRAIVSNSLPQTSATITFVDSYPPMAPTEGNRDLASQLSLVNEALGRGPMKIWDPLRAAPRTCPLSRPTPMPWPASAPWARAVIRRTKVWSWTPWPWRSSARRS
jgi:glutamate carboxypeptidase